MGEGIEICDGIRRELQKIQGGTTILLQRCQPLALVSFASTRLMHKFVATIWIILFLKNAL